MKQIFFIITSIAIVQTIAIAILIYRLKKAKIKLLYASFREKKLKSIIKGQHHQHKNLLKEKLLLTQRINLKLNHHEEVSKFFTYKGNSEKLYIDLLEIFFPLITYIEDKYPSLTKKDIVIIVLIHIGYDNQEISTIFNYTKRTIYKRRQIISRVIGISSLQLDNYIRNIGKSL